MVALVTGELGWPATTGRAPIAIRGKRGTRGDVHRRGGNGGGSGPNSDEVGVTTATGTGPPVPGGWWGFTRSQNAK
jgi:hypothetical protein